MNKKVLLISILAAIVVVCAAAGRFFLYQNQQKDQAGVRKVVESFGYTMKNFSLLSQTVKQDMEQNYKPFLSAELLSSWENDPSKAVGRLVSSPWPDKIDISSIKPDGANSYQVSGKIILTTGDQIAKGDKAITQPVDFTVSKVGDKWLITSAKTGEFSITEVN